MVHNTISTWRSTYPVLIDKPLLQYASGLKNPFRTLLTELDETDLRDRTVQLMGGKLCESKLSYAGSPYLGERACTQASTKERECGRKCERLGNRRKTRSGMRLAFKSVSVCNFYE